MKKKRFLFIYGQINGGGAERVLLDVLNNFDYINYEVDLLQIVGGGLLIDELPKNVNLIQTWDNYTLSYKIANRLSIYLGCDFMMKSQLQKSIGNKRYDVAISFLEGMPLKAHAMITNIAERNYSWVHCDLDKFRYEASVFRKKEEITAYNKMDAVICVAEDTRKAFIRRFPECKSVIKVIYNPIDCKKIKYLSKSYTVDNKAFTIVIVGRLTPPKKLDRAIRLANKIKKNSLPIKIQFIGDGELKADLQNQATELSVTNMIEFVGFKKNPYPYIKSADMLLSTSGYEGFSLVICEAMCLGTPVISTKTSGPTEIIDNNVYGILCEHDDEAIFNAVMKFYNSIELREQYSQKAINRADKFSVENCLNQIYAL